MPANERLVNIIREALANLPNVEEKRMFSGVCFMVDEKMCICISGDELMCRVGEKLYEEVMEMPGTRPMIMRDVLMKDFVYISQYVLKTKADFDYWITRSLAFNPFAKSSKTKPKKK